MNLNSLGGPNSSNQYTNLKYLSSGGMGDIYTAHDSFTSQTVAVKLIRILDESQKVLLEQEFKIASSLSHPNIVKTHFYSELSDSNEKYFYSVQEYCKNGNLRTRLSSLSDFLSISDSLSYFNNLLSGLKEAHKYIVHRDLKPENILISDDGSLKICDFGIAKYVDEITKTKTFKGWGSYPYMSPECWLLDANTKQMDIYSLGLIFFEILTLQKAFQGTTEAEYKDKHLFTNLPSILSIRTDVPAAFLEIIRKMTEKSLSARFKDVSEIISLISNFEKAQESSGINIQSILVKLHNKANAENETQLKAKKAEEEFANKQKLLNFSIEQLFDQFINVCNQVNIQLIDTKISSNKFIIPTNAAASTFRMAVSNGSLIISFYATDIVSLHIKHRKQQIQELQMRQYGMIVNREVPEHIEVDNVLLLGKVETNIQCNSKKIGFNLLLRNTNQEDVYGQWWISKFSDSLRQNNCYFGFEPPEFFNEYEFGRGNVMHTYKMKFQQISDADIISLIENMVS